MIKINFLPNPALAAIVLSCLANSPVFAVWPILSTTINLLSLNLSVKTVNSALRQAERFILSDQSRLLRGPNVMPPCRHSGERTEPARARPGPFLFHGFLPLPATSPIILVWAQGPRTFLRCVLTAA